MKIGIITLFRGLNYGACLQAFSTAEFLKRNNISVQLIDYRRPKWESAHNLRKFRLAKKIKFCFINYILHINAKLEIINWKKEKRFRDFILLLPITEPYTNISDLSKNEHLFDTYISGSDQIWNPKIMGSIDEIAPYFLSFIEKNKKKISYASSMGGYKYNQNEKNKIKNWLELFSSISVRENFSKMQLEDEMTKNVEVVLDPIFLLSKDQWSGIESPLKLDFEYILVYAVGQVEKCIEYAKAISKRTNLKVINISSGLLKKGVHKNIRGVGPKEFLWLIRNARYVVTSSFHGVAFSINFNRDFFCVYDKVLSIRSLDLLERLEMRNRVVENIEYLINTKLDIDHSLYKDYLEVLRKKSQKFLLNSIK